MSIKEKKEELLRLEDEIKRLKKAKRAKYRKNALMGVFLWSPAIVWTGYYLYNAITTNKYPGYLDYVTKKAYTTTKYSSITGETESEKEYAYKKDVQDDVLFYYEPWVKNEDGTYTSNTEKYILNNVSEKQIKRLLDKEDLSFDDLTVLSVKSHETIKNDAKITITPEDLEPHYEVIVYDVDNYDTIIDRETREDDYSDWGLAIGYILVTGMIECGLHAAYLEKGKLPFATTFKENYNIVANRARHKELVKELVK